MSLTLSAHKSIAFATYSQVLMHFQDMPVLLSEHIVLLLLTPLSIVLAAVCHRIATLAPDYTIYP
jgi:hypothetical protein